MSKIIRKLSGLALALSIVLVSGGWSLFGDGSPSNSELKAEYEKKLNLITKVSTEIWEMVFFGGKGPLFLTHDVEIIKQEEFSNRYGARVRTYVIRGNSGLNPIYNDRFPPEIVKNINENNRTSNLGLEYVMTDKGWKIRQEDAMDKMR